MVRVGTAAPSGSLGTIHGSIGARAAAAPEATALIHGSVRTTYRQLDRLAELYAARLSALGLEAGGFLPIRLPRSVRMVAVALAALKLGAAYAFIDPAWPDERVRDEIEQLRAGVFVADGTAPDGARTTVWSPPLLEPSEVERVLEAEESLLLPEVRPEDACCVFFTSGTTGRPKGVISPHSGTVRMVGAGTFADFGPDTVMAQAAALPWDACSLELWTPLLVGGTTILVDEPFLSGALLRGLISEHGKNTAWLTASLFNMLVDEDPGCFAGLRTLMIGGERLSPAHVRAFLTSHPDIALINGYGPVECTIFISTRRIVLEDCDAEGGIPIGTPCPETGAFVLRDEQECADGEVGELCASGAGLALGYLGDPELSEAKFPTLNLGGRPERVYRTGDLVLRDAAGVLHYRGRADRQLKVRGHRIEPGDIEAVLGAYPGVARAIVQPRFAADGSAVGLGAFYTTSDGQPVGHDVLDRHLRTRLAAYQVPDSYLHLSAVPLTANGKLDAKALEGLEAVGRGTSGGARALGALAAELDSDPILRAVVDVLASVLPPGTPVSPDATFTELGATSLDAGRICARLNDSLRRPVPVSQAFRTPTARSLADWLRETESSDAAESDGTRETESGPVRLSALQAHMFIEHLVHPDDLSMHCVVAWRIDGRPDRAALRSAFEYLHGRHGMLGGVFSLGAEPVVQPFGRGAPPLTELIADTVEDALAALDREMARPFELETGHVWRPVYVAVRREPVTLLGISAHHTVFDGASAPVLADELAVAYNALRKGAVPDLAQAPSPARIDRIRASHLRYADLDAQRAHWRRTLSDMSVLEYPRDAGVKEPGTGSGTGPASARIEALVPADLAEGIGKLAAVEAVSPFAVYLAAYAQSMARLTGLTGFGVGTPFNQRADSALDRAVSCLISLVCVRTEVDPDAPPAEAIAATARACAEAFAAQDVAFDEASAHFLRQSPAERPSLFQNLFVLQDNPAAALPLDGVRSTPFLPGYPDAPGELCTELWPLASGGFSLVASYRPTKVSGRFVRALVDGFLHRLSQYPA